MGGWVRWRLLWDEKIERDGDVRGRRGFEAQQRRLADMEMEM